MVAFINQITQIRLFKVRVLVGLRKSKNLHSKITEAILILPLRDPGMNTGSQPSQIGLLLEFNIDHRGICSY